MAETVSLGDHTLEVFIFPLRIDSNTLEKSTNKSVSLRFFPEFIL